MKDVGRDSTQFTVIHHGGKEYLHPGMWQQEFQPLLYTNVDSCPPVTRLSASLNDIGLPSFCTVSARCRIYQILPSVLSEVIS